MRCKSCDAELSDMDLKRKDVDGSFIDLCTGCYRVSEETLIEQDWLDEEGSEEAPAPSEVHPREMFDRFVEKHNLMKSWAEGLGLRWTPEERQAHFYDKCYSSFMDLYRSGYGTVASLERACGIHRADRRREYSGASFAFASEDALEGMGGTRIETHRSGPSVSH